MYYFSYAANISVAWFQKRIASAEPLDTYELHGYRLEFNKIGADGSSKANAVYTGNQEDSIWGVVYQVAEEDRHALENGYNSRKHGYIKQNIMVEVDYEPHQAFMFVAHEDSIDDNLKPYSWYVFHLLHGAMSADFPMEYVGMLQNVDTLTDTNIQRACNENEVYA
ncbi:MAG: gamma-glutamylcyclotransferase [Burkholderiales bacterium]|nr:gamma-glutamylcyclotransferase [Burkholderiales bacterium]